MPSPTITHSAETGPTTGRPTEWSQLLEAARNGDDDALGQICQRFREHLLLTADNDLGGDIRGKFGASDVVQQSMLEVHNDFRRFAGKSEAEFRRWITRLVERNLIDASRQYRQTKRRDIAREIPITSNRSRRNYTSGRNLNQSELALTAREGTASGIVSRQEDDQALAAAINQLSCRQRQVVELRHRQSLSYAQIADQLNTSETAARKTWSRAVEQLRQTLAEQHERQPSQPR